jgi:hypothetical protein
VGSVLLIFLIFCVVLLCVLTFWFPCCDVRYDFPIKSMLGIFTFWFPCCDVRYDFRIKTMFGSSLPPVVCCRSHALFMLCVFILFVFVLCTLCWQFLWIVHFWLPIRSTLTFIIFVVDWCFFLSWFPMKTFNFFRCSWWVNIFHMEIVFIQRNLPF